jgi:hypothetical protein
MMIGLERAVIKPNAKCPECNDDDFYYENEFGSRVFFDTLAPDWDKHPCTDSSLSDDERLWSFDRLWKNSKCPMCSNLILTETPMGTIRTVRGRKAVYLYYASYGGGSGPL